MGYSIQTKRQQTIPYFRNGLINCNVIGYPPTNITWTVNGSMINFQSSNKYRLLGNGSLLIYYINYKDAGIYRITVQRPAQGIPLTESITVNVGG